MHSSDGPNMGGNQSRQFAGSLFHNSPNGRKHPTFWSSSFRNPDLAARFWGAMHEGEEKEDNSDSDDEQDEHQNECFTRTREFLRALFPNSYPLIWLVLPFVFCLVVAVAAYGDNSDKDGEGLVIFSKETAIFTRGDLDTDTQTSFVKQISSRDLTLQGVLVLVMIFVLNAAVWVAFMIVRAIMLTIIVNIGLYEQQTVSSLLTTVDPELVYFVWSVAVYIFWKRNLTKGKLFSMATMEATKTVEQLYVSSVFGPAMFVHPFTANCSRTVCLAIVLLATRRLLHSIMVFYFELGFMSNMSGQVGKYLNKYAALRKLNTRWAAYQMFKETASQGSDDVSQEDEEHMEARCDELRRGRSMLSVASRASRYSRYSRHPSLRLPLRAMPSLVRDEPEVPPTRTSGPYNNVQYSRAPKDIGGRFVSRAVRVNYFRFRFLVNENIQIRELRGQGIPSQLTRASIERIKHSKIHHWVLLQYIAVFPPAIFLQGRRIELDSKAVARSVAESLFRALAADAAELAAEAPKDPPQKLRGGTFGDVLQQTKQTQPLEHQRTVTWLGSPDLQKVVPLDPADEGSFSIGAGAGPAETEGYLSTSVGDNAASAAPNNSTNSTDHTAEGGDPRLDAPSGTSELPSVPSPTPEETASAPTADKKEQGVPPPESAAAKPLEKGIHKPASLRCSGALGPPPATTAAEMMEKPPAQPSPTTSQQFTQQATQGPPSEAAPPAEVEEGQGAPGSDDDSENLDLLEGSFEFSVGNAGGEARARARRGMTQHISTLTPFNIAIRAPSVDAEDTEPERPSFTADQKQRRPRPAKSFAVVIRPEDSASMSLEEKQGAQRGASRRLVRNRRDGSSRQNDGGEVELPAAHCSNESVLPRDCGPDCHRYSHESIGIQPEYCGNEVPVTPPHLGGQQTALSGSASPPWASEDYEMQHQQLTKQDAAILGTVNINSSLFYDGNVSMSLNPKPSSSPSDYGPGVCTSTTNAEGGCARRLLDPNNAGEEEYTRRPRYGCTPAAPDYFTRAFVEMFLKGDEVDEFMKQVDLAGHGKINQPMLKRAVVSIYKMRKSLLKSLTSQASICKTVRRMISVVLWVATLVGMLLVFGVNLNTVLVSGAASISALVVALSYIYQNFITAVIFVAFTNPYNVGDRIRIDNGEPMYVKNIHTYTTEFVTVHAKPIVYSNSVLFGRQLTNESRATNATLSMPMRLDIRTQLQALRFLEAGMRRAIAARPMDFVKDSFSIYITDVQPGRWMDITVWLSAVEGWGNWPKVFRLRTDMYLVLQRLCIRFGISYQEPVLPIHFNNPNALPTSPTPQPPTALSPGHQFQPTAAHGAVATASSMESTASAGWGSGFCYRGTPSPPPGVPLDDFCCEPSTFPGFNPAASTAELPGQGKSASAQCLSSSGPERTRNHHHHHQDESWESLQLDGINGGRRRTQKRATGMSRSSSLSSVASLGCQLSFDGSSISSFGEQGHREKDAGYPRTHCTHADNRQEWMAPDFPRRISPRVGEYCNSTGSYNWDRASLAHREPPCEFKGCSHEDAKPRRRHRNSEIQMNSCTTQTREY